MELSYAIIGTGALGGYYGGKLAQSGNLMKQADSRQLILDLMVETIEAANFCGADIDKSYAQEMLNLTDNMTPYAPSMRLDYDARHHMEIKAIYSNPIQAALKAGYSMKKVAVLEQQLRFVENSYSA